MAEGDRRDGGGLTSGRQEILVWRVLRPNMRSMWPTHFAKITRTGRHHFKSVRPVNAKGD